MTEFEVRALALLERIAQAVEGRCIQTNPRLNTSEHAALLAAIAAAAGSAVFTSGEVIQHALVAGDLRTALLASPCGLNPRKLGKLLRKIEGTACGGLVIERLDVDSAGVIWRCRAITTRTATLALA